MLWVLTSVVHSNTRSLGADEIDISVDGRGVPASYYKTEGTI